MSRRHTPAPRYTDHQYRMLKWRNGYRLSSDDRRCLGIIDRRVADRREVVNG